MEGSGGGARMREPGLLGDGVVMVEFEVEPARAESGDAHPEGSHHRLSVKARSNTLGISRIGWRVVGSHGVIMTLLKEGLRYVFAVKGAEGKEAL